jgi:hypothetical protein
MGFSLGFVLLFKVFDFLLEKPDFTSALQLYFIQLTFHFNPLVDLLFNLPTYNWRSPSFTALNLSDFSRDMLAILY